MRRAGLVGQGRGERGVAAGLLGLLCSVTDTVPSRLVQAVQRLRPPAADGVPDRRGQQS